MCLLIFQVPADRKSYEIVEQSLKTVGGSLVSLHSLVTLCVTPDQRRHFAQVTTGGSGNDYSNGADDGAREGSGANTGAREGSGANTGAREGSGANTGAREGSGANTGAREGSGANTGAREGSLKDHVAAVLSSFSCMSACVALVPCCRQKIAAPSGRQKESAATVTLVIGQQGNRWQEHY